MSRWLRDRVGKGILIGREECPDTLVEGTLIALVDGERVLVVKDENYIYVSNCEHSEWRPVEVDISENHQPSRSISDDQVNMNIYEFLEWLKIVNQGVYVCTTKRSTLADMGRRLPLASPASKMSRWT